MLDYFVILCSAWFWFQTRNSGSYLSGDRQKEKKGRWVSRTKELDKNKIILIWLSFFLNTFHITHLHWIQNMHYDDLIVVDGSPLRRGSYKNQEMWGSIAEVHKDGSPMHLPHIPCIAKFTVLYISPCYSFLCIVISTAYMIPMLALSCRQFEKTKK